MKQQLVSLKGEIKYRADIEYPKDAADIVEYLPRLCAKHLSKKELETGISHWNLGSERIRDAIAKGKAAKSAAKKRGGDAR